MRQPLPPMDYGMAPAGSQKQEIQGAEYYGQGIDGDPEIMKLQLKTEDIMRDLHLLLKGKVVVDGKAITEGDPLANKEGINRILSLVHARFNRNTILANVTEMDIRKICISLRANLISELVIRHDDWKVNSPSDALFIVNVVDDMVFLALTRAITEGGTGKTLGSLAKMILHKENVNTGGDKKGFWNKLF